MEEVKTERTFLNIWCPKTFVDQLDLELKKLNEKQNLNLSRSAFVRKIISDYLAAHNDKGFRLDIARRREPDE